MSLDNQLFTLVKAIMMELRLLLNEINEEALLDDPNTCESWKVFCIELNRHVFQKLLLSLKENILTSQPKFSSSRTRKIDYGRNIHFLATL